MTKPESIASLQLIKKLKEQNFGACCESVISVGPQLKLAPVGSWILQETQIIQDFVNWRAENRANFFTQVPQSVRSMTSYLRNYSIGDPRRVLFAIFWQSGHVGHIGLANISMTTAELDNVMRGRRTYPGMMDEVLRVLKRWAFENLDVSKIYLRVKNNNLPAIALYSRAGFEPLHEDIAHYLNQDDAVMLKESGGLFLVADLAKEYKLPRRAR